MAVRNNPFKPIIQAIPAPLRNRYFLVLIFFFAWMIFFDKHDVLTQWRLQESHQQLEEHKAFYEEKIQDTKKEHAVKEKNMEQFAREQYYMKKDKEDVYIFVDEEEEE